MLKNVSYFWTYQKYELKIWGHIIIWCSLFFVMFPVILDRSFRTYHNHICYHPKDLKMYFQDLKYILNVMSQFRQVRLQSKLKTKNRINIYFHSLL